MTEIVHKTFPFDVEAFLQEGNECRLATNGPTVRPTWFHWEDGAFWFISGPHAKLYHRVQKDPRVSIVIDVFETNTGRVLQVMATDEVKITPYDTARAKRMLDRYLGADESKWPTKPDDYPGYIRGEGPPGVAWLKMTPKRILSFNFSFGLVTIQASHSKTMILLRSGVTAQHCTQVLNGHLMLLILTYA